MESKTKSDSFFLKTKKSFKSKENENNKKSYEEKFKNVRKEHKKTKDKDDAEKTKSNENKKPFDKKTYRLKKYSKKYKLEKWEEQRKKKLLREYYKENKTVSDTGLYKTKGFDEDEPDSSVGRFVRHPDLIEQEEKSKSKIKNKDPFWKAKEEYNKIQQEKVEKKNAIEKAKEERKEKLQEYKKKKQERFKKLSKKTKKGQPVMTGRLELLLEKIQNQK